MVSDIQAYVEESKKHEETTHNLSTKLYVDKIESRITFKIKKGYDLELLTPKRMKCWKFS